MKIPKFLRRYLIRKIKMRVYKSIRPYDDYQQAISFITDAPIKEWRIRLWCVTHFKDESKFGNYTNWQKLLDYITH